MNTWELVGILSRMPPGTTVSTELLAELVEESERNPSRTTPEEDDRRQSLGRDRFTHLVDTTESIENPLARAQLTRHEFGRRLYSLMISKGMLQSDLARAAGTPRESVSGYVRGKRMPDASTLKKLAEALEVTPDEILPGYPEQSVDVASDSPLHIKASSADPRYVWFRLNRLVKASSLPKIIAAVDEGSDYAEPADKDSK